jgi:hypothetical protein
MVHVLMRHIIISHAVSRQINEKQYNTKIKRKIMGNKNPLSTYLIASSAS